MGGHEASAALSSGDDRGHPQLRRELPLRRHREPAPRRSERRRQIQAPQRALRRPRVPESRLPSDRSSLEMLGEHDGIRLTRAFQPGPVEPVADLTVASRSIA
ncbi:hypothetical protein BE20_00190 [Sorangium cellulosum]|uniref:Uncharacterized protein n=1 Tax=Sorangium cellulosum TaxID=56 RepID=A0A150RUD1_SORCE|nr:hypothetical protein BE18_35075 [Sorangium cellulosum]KYF88987.1 hypothetical protein BE20_00190 [Sorangium cellulosum]